MLSLFLALNLYLHFSGGFALPPQALKFDLNAATTLSLTGDENVTMPVTNIPDNTLNASNVVVHCYDNPPAPAAPIYLPVNILECITILPSVLLEPEVMSTARWTPTIPMVLPRTFRAGDCRIGISANSQASRDIFQEVLILQRAALIMDQCVKGRTKNQRLGGWVSIGPREVFQVSVFTRP